MEERLEQAELDALWLPGDPIASAERLAAAAAESDRSELVRAELQTQRARALGLQGRIEEAEALLDSLEPAAGVLEVRVLLERGRLAVVAGDRVGGHVAPDEPPSGPRGATGTLRSSVEAAVTCWPSPTDPHADQWIEEGLADLSSTERCPRTLRWGVVAARQSAAGRGCDDGDAGAALVSLRGRAGVRRRATGRPTSSSPRGGDVGRALRELGRIDEALVVQRRLAAERPGEAAVVAELAALAEIADSAVGRGAYDRIMTSATAPARRRGAIGLDSRLTGVLGGRTASAFEKAFGMRTVADLLSHYPRRYAKRGELTALAKLPLDENVTIVAEVLRVQERPMRARRGSILEVKISDGEGILTLTFFNQAWRSRELHPGVRGHLRRQGVGVPRRAAARAPRLRAVRAGRARTP